MSPDELFTLTNPLAAIGWLALVAAPGRRWATLVAGRVIPLILAVCYLLMFVLHFGGSRGSFSTLAGVSELFQNPWLLLAGWVHYLAFDLVVGAWEVEDSTARGISRWLVAPCLLLTFLVGPIGFLVYNALAASRGARSTTAALM
jgi:hypothetical protein